MRSAALLFTAVLVGLELSPQTAREYYERMEAARQLERGAPGIPELYVCFDDEDPLVFVAVHKELYRTTIQPAPRAEREHRERELLRHPSVHAIDLYPPELPHTVGWENLSWRPYRRGVALPPVFLEDGVLDKDTGFQEWNGLDSEATLWPPPRPGDGSEPVPNAYRSSHSIAINWKTLRYQLRAEPGGVVRAGWCEVRKIGRITKQRGRP